MLASYSPEMDVTEVLNEDDVTFFQELIGVLSKMGNIVDWSCGRPPRGVSTIANRNTRPIIEKDGQIWITESSGRERKTSRRYIEMLRSKWRTACHNLGDAALQWQHMSMYLMLPTRRRDGLILDT